MAVFGLAGAVDMADGDFDDERIDFERFIETVCDDVDEKNGDGDGVVVVVVVVVFIIFVFVFALALAFVFAATTPVDAFVAFV